MQQQQVLKQRTDNTQQTGTSKLDNNTTHDKQHYMQGISLYLSCANLLLRALTSCNEAVIRNCVTLPSAGWLQKIILFPFSFFYFLFLFRLSCIYLWHILYIYIFFFFYQSPSEILFVIASPRTTPNSKWLVFILQLWAKHTQHRLLLPLPSSAVKKKKKQQIKSSCHVNRHVMSVPFLAIWHSGNAELHFLFPVLSGSGRV